MGPYLNRKQFCERYGVSESTEERGRQRGGDDWPPYVRVGPRRILYRLSDCEAWAARRTYSSRAAEYAAGLAA